MQPTRAVPVNVIIGEGLPVTFVQGLVNKCREWVICGCPLCCWRRHCRRRGRERSDGATFVKSDSEQSLCCTSSLIQIMATTHEKQMRSVSGGEPSHRQWVTHATVKTCQLNDSRRIFLLCESCAIPTPHSEKKGHMPCNIH